MASAQELRRKSPIYFKMFLTSKSERKSSWQQWTYQIPSLSSPNPCQLKKHNFILHTILPSYLIMYDLAHSCCWYDRCKALLYLQKWVSWQRGKHTYYFTYLLRHMETEWGELPPEKPKQIHVFFIPQVGHDTWSRQMGPEGPCVRIKPYLSPGKEALRTQPIQQLSIKPEKTSSLNLCHVWD